MKKSTESLPFPLRDLPVTVDSIEANRGLSTICLPNGTTTRASDQQLVHALARAALDEWDRAR